MKRERWCIDMRSNHILNSVAMLSTLYEREKGDYYDVISPFVMSVFPKNIGDTISAEELSAAVKLRYGFNMPEAVVELILKRLIRKTDRFIARKGKQYTVVEKLDSSILDQIEYEIKKKNENVINCYVKFVEGSTGEVLLYPEADRQLRDFFGYFGNAIYLEEDLQLLVSKWNSKHPYNHYRIGKFITIEREKDSSVYREIIDVVKGYLVFNALYYFFQRSKKEVYSKLKGVKFFLDTAIVLDILKYHDDGNLSTELEKLIREYDGEVAIFEESLQEIKGILFAYLKQGYAAREKMRITKYKVEGYSDQDISRDINTIESRIRAKNIDIFSISKLEYKHGSDTKSLGLIDEDELRKTYLGYFKEWQPTDSAVDHDIRAISYVSRIRKGQVPRQLENCKAIFISRNNSIVVASRAVQVGGGHKESVGLAMSAIDLTSLLWLKSFSSRDDIPDALLMERVYAAIRPSDDVIDKYLREVDQLERDEKLSEDAVILMRTSSAFRDEIVEKSENFPKNITREMILEIQGRFEQNIIDKERAENDRKVRVEDEKRKNESEKRMSAKAKESAFEKKLFVIKLLEWSTKLLGVIILIVATYLYSSAELYTSGVYIATFLVIFFLIGLIDSLNEKWKVVRKRILRFAEGVYNRQYEKKMNEYRSFWDEDTN